jgi:hypothetical protein
MPDFSKIIDAQNLLFESNLGKILSSPAFELSMTVNQSIGRLIAIETPYIDEMLKVSAFQERFFQSQMIDHQNALSKILENLPLNDLAWRSHLLDISKFAILSQTVLSQISLETMGDALDIKENKRSRLQSVLLNFSKSYSTLFDSLETQPSIILSLPPVISKLPAVEFFNGVIVANEITIGEGEDVEFVSQNRQIVEEIRRETEDQLEALLAELNPEFIVLLRGARQSLISENPDRTRHVATSLRELFTHILHTLAPDEKVKEWSNEPKNYDKGRPTRKARLLYISRELNHDPFSVFIEKDIDANLAFLQLFQQGTHEIIPKYTDDQLKAMLVRMESTLRYILEITHSH